MLNCFVEKGFKCKEQEIVKMKLKMHFYHQYHSKQHITGARLRRGVKKVETSTSQPACVSLCKNDVKRVESP